MRTMADLDDDIPWGVRHPYTRPGTIMPKPLPRRPRPYPERLEEKPSPMTIAAGFVCRDGIVICADSEVSTDFEKYEESKIFTLASVTGPTVVFAGSGWSDFIKMTVSKIKTAAQFATTANEIEEIVEEVIMKVHRNHIRHYPSDPKPFVSLLIGIKDRGDLRLLQTSGTSIRPVSGSAFLGAGETLGHYLSRGLSPELELTDKAALLAVQILEQVKASVPGCGGKFSEVTILPEEGRLRRLRPSQLLDIEFRGREFNGILKPLLMSFSDDSISDEDFEATFGEFDRQCHKVRQEAKERMQRAKDRNGKN